jgi:hypothetical protein
VRRVAKEGGGMTTSALHEIPGGEALIDWFGQVPAFHDADVMAINLVSNGTSVLNLWTWRMTDKVDAQGYFEIEKHIFVDIVLREVTYVSLCQFQLPGIIFQLHITRSGDEFDLSWEGSYGVSGTIRAKQVSVESRPGIREERIADWERVKRSGRGSDAR